MMTKMIGCDTCRRRKVKCDGRPGVCERCEKLRLQCLRHGLAAANTAIGDSKDADLTQAGHKRLRTTAACVRCRSKKLKCDAQRPACSLCFKKGIDCEYATVRRRPSKLASREAGPAVQQAGDQHDEDSSHGDVVGGVSGESPRNHDFDLELGDEPSHSKTHSHSPRRARQANETDGPPVRSRILKGSMSAASNDADQTPGSQNYEPHEPPTGRHLLPYLDSFLENIHPISCNNFLHPGTLCAGIDRAPPLLLLAVCGSSSKFMPGQNSLQKGAIWVDEAKSLIMKNLGGTSTLTISAIQFLALHEMHNGNYTSAWNLVGTAIRMTLDLKLYQTDPSTPFLQQECRRRLMWSVFVSDLLFDNEQLEIDMEILSDLPLPCNLWNFTQGIPCKTLTLRQMQTAIEDAGTQQSTNHCAFLISILVIRRKILRYIRSIHAAIDVPWMEGSLFASLRNDLLNWRNNLPKNYAFNERHMYMFRVSRHLDIFLMIHAYYHQSCILLFGIFLPDSLEPNLEQVAAQAPSDFLQDCREEFLFHAKEISQLIERIFNIEPEHLFRDPWFSLCIWDGTCALLAGVPWQEIDAESRSQGARLLTTNLQALQNTMPKMPLAEQIYYHCCAAIRHYGLEHDVDAPLPQTPSTFRADTSTPLHLEPFCRRYLYFTTTRTNESPEWEELLAASGTSGTDKDDVAESPHSSLGRMNNGRLRTMGFTPAMNMSSFDAGTQPPPQADMSFWSPDEMQWWQLQSPYSDQNAFANAMGAEMRHMQL